MKEEVKGYIICQPGWEYNDEVYYRFTDDAIYDTMERVYLSKEEAEKEADKISITSWSGINLQEWAYDLDDLLLDTDNFSKEDLKNYIIKIGGKVDSDDWDWRTPDKMKLSWIRFLEERMDIYFAYVSELQIV